MRETTVFIKAILELTVLYWFLKVNIKNRSDRNYFVYSLLFLMLFIDVRMLITREFSLLWLNEIYILCALIYTISYLIRNKWAGNNIVSSLVHVQEIGNSEIANGVREAIAIIKRDNMIIVSANNSFKKLMTEIQPLTNIEDIVSDVIRGKSTFEIKQYNNISLFLKASMKDFGNKYVILFIEDITNEETLKREAENQDKVIKKIWDEMEIPIVIRDLNDNICYLNKSAIQYFECDDDCVGKQFSELFNLERVNFEENAVTKGTFYNSKGIKKYYRVEQKKILLREGYHILSFIFDLTEINFEKLKSHALYKILSSSEAVEISHYLIVDMINNKILLGEKLEQKIGIVFASWDQLYNQMTIESKKYLDQTISLPESFRADRIILNNGKQFIVEEIILDEENEILGFILNHVDESVIFFSPEVIGKNILNHIREGILIINFDGAIQYANESICRILGYSRDELLIKNLLQISKNLTIETIKQNWEISRGYQSYSVERVYYHKDGAEIPVEITGKHIDFGESEKLILIVRDVSERVIYRKNFINSQMKVTQLFDALQDGIYEIKLPSRTVTIYQQFDMEKGFVGVEIPFLKWISNIIEEDRSIVYESIDIITSEKTSDFSFEYRYKYNSEWVWLRARGRYLEHEEGASILLINQNITEIKDIATKLDESKYILTESERISHMAHWRYDVIKNTFSVSETFDEMFKIKDSSDEITHEQFLDLIFSSDADYFDAKFSRAIWNEEALDVIFRIARGTEIRYIQMFGKTYYGNNKLPIYVIGNTVDITEKMLSARRLEESKKLMESIIEQSPTGIVVTKRTGKIEVINEEATKLLSLTEDFELTFDRIQGFILRQYENENDEPLDDCLKSIQSGSAMNLTLRAKHALDKWIMLYANPMHDEEGRFTGNIIILIDITERTIMQQRLYEQTSKLVNAERLAQLGHFEFQNNFEKVYLSDVIFDILETEHPISLSVEYMYNLVADEDRERINSIVDVIKRKDGKYTLEFKLKTVKGNQKHVQIILVRRSYEENRYYEGTIQDVSVIKNIMERIRQSEKEKDILISSVSDQIIYYNADRTVVTLNHSKYKTDGENLENVIGKKCYEIFSPLENECDKCAVLKTLETKKPQIREYSNDYKWFEQSTHPVFDDNGNVMGVVEIVRDITKDRFIRDKRSSIDKIQIYDQVSKGIAHDYNNKIMGILGYLNLINEFKTLPKTVREYVSIISKTASTLQETTEQLLMISNKSVMDIEPLNLISIVDGVVKFINHLYDVHVECDFPKEKIIIQGNEDMIFNILISLIINSIDATENIINPMIKVYIDESNFSENGEVSLSVTDNGIGIEEANKHKVFEPFFTTKLNPDRVGMGLSTVQSVIKELGGNISFTSEIGETKFVLTFKGALDVEDIKKDDLIYSEHKENGILIIDDEDIVRMLFANVLREQGYNVYEASNAIEGMNIYLEHKEEIELVIVDMIMPEMSGREAFDGLKKIDDQVKIIITTGYSNDEDVRYVMQHGAVDLFKKPVAISEIKERVAKFLKKSVADKNAKSDANEIDVKEALRKLDGNERLYDHICTKFYIKYKELPEEIIEDLKEGRYYKIRASAHNIKGLAGNIGDKKLEAICYELETNIRNDNFSEDKIYEFVDTLKSLLLYLEETTDAKL